MTDRERRALHYIAGRIASIERTLAENPKALAASDVAELDNNGRAILWDLMTLADATGRLSDNVRSRHPEIPWRQVKDFRNVAAHGYDELFLGEVERICRDELPALRRAVRAELEMVEREFPSP